MWGLDPNPLPERICNIIVRVRFIPCIHRLNGHNKSYHVLYVCSGLDTVPGTLELRLYPYNNLSRCCLFLPLEMGKRGTVRRHACRAHKRRLGFSYVLLLLGVPERSVQNGKPSGAKTREPSEPQLPYVEMKEDCYKSSRCLDIFSFLFPCNRV